MSTKTHLLLLADEWLKDNPHPTTGQLCKLLVFVDGEARIDILNYLKRNEKKNTDGAE